jgi:hypothetical protein
VTNDATAIQNAINAASAAGGGVVYLPTGKFLIGSALTMKAYVTLRGAGENATLLTGNTRLIRVPNGESSWRIEDMTLKPWNGAAIYIPGTSTFWQITNTDFNQQAGTFPAIQADSATSDVENGVISKCSFSMVLNATKPLIRWVGTGGTVNQNSIQNCLFQANYNESQYMIFINDSSNNYCYSNSFKDICFETCEGGAMWLGSQSGAVLQNCMVYDMIDTVNNDLFYIGRSSSGTALSVNNTMMNCGYVGSGTIMLSGKYHINLLAANYTLMLNCAGTPTTLTYIESGNDISIGSEITSNGTESARWWATKKVSLRYLPTYADNAAALIGGLGKGSLYQTATGEVRIVTE